MATPKPKEKIHFLTDQEAREMFDRAVRHRLGISGGEFRRKWHAGEYTSDVERAEITALAMLLPLVE